MLLMLLMSFRAMLDARDALQFYHAGHFHKRARFISLMRDYCHARYVRYRVIVIVARSLFFDGAVID